MRAKIWRQGGYRKTAPDFVMISLQEKFISSKGQPVMIGKETIAQMDNIPIRSGAIKLTFLSQDSRVLCGVALKSAKGHLLLSNNQSAKFSYVWNQPGLPQTVQHVVECPDGILRIWNIYKASGDEDLTKADAWTNNAGMIIEELEPGVRRYHCSDGMGDFQSIDLVFEIAWQSTSSL